MLFLMLVACKSAQTDLPLIKNCPSGGDCEVQVLKETKLYLEVDASGVSNVYFEEDIDFQIISIQYRDSKMKDYSEEIYLQIPSQFKEIQSKNHSLKNQKLVVGKFCKCPDAGFIKIFSGELKLTNHKDFMSLDLNIKSDRNHIAHSINLDI